MRNFSIGRFLRIGALALSAVLLVACGGGRTKSDALVQDANVPASFDVTLIAALGITKVVIGWPLQILGLAGMAWLLARNRTPVSPGP